ncbi:PQQ-dependent dehydrogenase, methanol/ethanol family [Rhodoplanes sp. Z2-YC6860]|uniref:PQQ-dependent dehydrogenase, methanol/ethanol family n=1 Tax=Rhodoplanes sp. Z2-YC6860 TaxID=674703 RepID=UPI00078CF920|nr:PQQ-dependent dehydrogenase, methanol/ethanol family [Rhodoplanes sp. Z2-YC6860]AMN41905.1 alcohol dehydrogenase [Rhodoplanes sp. Z2-YC6860]
MVLSRQFLRSISATAIIAASVSLAGAQQTIAPVSNTPVPGPVPEILQKYTPVTAERLKQPEDGNWLLFRRNYNGWGFSPLKEITPDNASRLQLVWSMATGQTEGHQAPPIVNNGVMFVATPGNQVIAVEAKTGTLLWRYKRPLPDDLVNLHPTSRGVALYGDKVYFASADCVLVALDAKTGKVAWTAKVDDYKKAYYMSLAPLIVDGKVMLGASGGELGVRGFVAALDAETGKELWKTYTVPAPGEPGSETWPAGGDHYKRGGGSIWVTGTYDPETNLAFWGTGNAAPWFGDQRPGDNLYTSSVIALDVATGQIKGHHQYHWNDSWDWDEVSPPIVVDYQHDGRTVKGLIDVSRSGYIWQLERTAGKINFVAGQPYVRQNVFKSLDPKTGRPDIDETKKPGTGKTAEFCPSLWGGKDWPPVAFSPQTRLLYIPANDNLCTELTGEAPKYVVGERFMGVKTNILKIVAGADHVGELQAWNVDTGKKAWTTNMPSFMWGPVLATGGDVLFAGGTNDRMFRAFDAKTGKVLWETPTSSGITAVPVSFAVDGKQYIAVQSGWGVDSQKMQSRFDLLFPGKYPDVPQGGAINVYAVK